LRLLLDEHYSPKIAEALRERGHDVASVKERDDLRGLSDREVWAGASGERRALVTENVADFMPLVHEATAAGERYPGIVFTSARSLPRDRGSIGLYVETLDAFLAEHRADEALADRVHWLDPA
jgi:predicted nuclease of predicted toxin-antitoxin system